jgi:hypothetical protein
VSGLSLTCYRHAIRGQRWRVACELRNGLRQVYPIIYNTTYENPLYSARAS